MLAYLYNMNRILTLALFIFATIAVAPDLSAQIVPQDQNENLWKTLGKISFIKEYDELLGTEVDAPVFGDAVKDMDGKTVNVTGYIIPVEGYQGHTRFIFSAYPYNMCYFCGGAGPETVMEVYAKKPIKFTADRITIRGKLVLNDGDINKLMYMLMDAYQVK